MPQTLALYSFRVETAEPFRIRAKNICPRFGARRGSTREKLTNTGRKYIILTNAGLIRTNGLSICPTASQ